MNKRILRLLCALLVTSCASHVDRQHSEAAITKTLPAPTLLGFESVHVRIRRELQLQPGDYVESCGKLVFAGPVKQLKPDGSYGEEVVIADGPAAYYDNSSGKLVAECSFWRCFSDNRYCDKYCPPANWKCKWYVP